MSIIKEPFGTLADGRVATLYTLTNAQGASVKITDFAATVVSIVVPDRKGVKDDVLLGCDSAEAYANVSTFLGQTVGRVANRIAGARFSLNGVEYTLAANDRGNNLHGGPTGFHKRLFTRVFADDLEGEPCLTLAYDSPDGEEGFPGNVSVQVAYRWTNQNELHIRYTAKSDQDTVFGMTAHPYFNLGGENASDRQASLLRSKIMIHADRYLPIDATAIPLGMEDVTGTPFDLRTPIAFAEGLAHTDNVQMQHGGGYDHAFMPNGAGMREVAVVVDEACGRRMRVSTDQPSIQLYSGNFVGDERHGRKAYGHREGFCLETQCPPDAIHHADWPSPILRAGEVYDTTTIYAFDVVD